MAFREQTAGHNALLLFVHLALSMMEGRLRNAFRDLRAKRAEVRAQPQLVPVHLPCSQPDHCHCEPLTRSAACHRFRTQNRQDVLCMI